MPQASARTRAQPTPERPPAAANHITTLLLGDEQPLIRRGIRALFDPEPAYHIQAEASDSNTLLRLAHAHQPDAILLDTALPGPDIIDTVHQLTTQHPHHTPVVLLAHHHPGNNWLLGAVRAGARGLLSKQAPPEEILAAVHQVTHGGYAMNTHTVNQILTALHRPHPPRPHHDISLLTRREKQVLLLVAQGLTNQQISHALVLSDATVKSHFHRVCHKLALRNRVDAVILAYETGLAETHHGTAAAHFTAPTH